MYRALSPWACRCRTYWGHGCSWCLGHMPWQSSSCWPGAHVSTLPQRPSLSHPRSTKSCHSQESSSSSNSSRTGHLRLQWLTCFQKTLLLQMAFRVPACCSQPATSLQMNMWAAKHLLTQMNQAPQIGCCLHFAPQTALQHQTRRPKCSAAPLRPSQQQLLAATKPSPPHLPHLHG